MSANDPVSLSSGDRLLLRALAESYRVRCEHPKWAVKRELWYSHNALEPTRPLLFCDPENGWHEIIPDAALQCGGALARQWEFQLRRKLFYAEYLDDDRVCEPVLEIGLVRTETGWGLRETRTGGQDGGAYHWDAPIKNYAADLEKLRPSEIIPDRAGTERLRDLAAECFEGLLDVSVYAPLWSVGPSAIAARLRGLEQIMYDMYDEPDNLHRLMGFLSGSLMRQLDGWEQSGLLTSNTGNQYVGSGGWGFLRGLEPGTGTVRCAHLWGFAESQETVGVSAEMYGEFILPYELPQLERFGINCYGCCEPLDKRWRQIERIPRLRRVSVSAWADAEKMAEYLGDRYVYSAKPNPSPLSRPDMDRDVVRKDIRGFLAAGKKHGCHMELIMKDCHTLGGNPRNAIDWCRIVREEIDRL